MFGGTSLQSVSAMRFSRKAIFLSFSSGNLGFDKLEDILLCSIVLESAVMCSTVLCSTYMYSTVLCSTIPCSTVLYSTVLCSTVPCSGV